MSADTYSRYFPPYSYQKLGMVPQSRQNAKLYKPSELGLPQPLTRWRERGWESPNSDEGTYTVVLFVNTYFVHGSITVAAGMASLSLKM
jgi:hypothetical protein